MPLHSNVYQYGKVHPKEMEDHIDDSFIIILNLYL